MEPCDFCKKPVSFHDEKFWGDVLLCRDCDAKLTAQYIEDMEQRREN